MIPELGHFLLITAVVLALMLAVLPCAGYLKNNRQLMLTARPMAVCLFVLVAASFVLLTWGFINNDFSITYVANNSNSMLPLVYRISGVWGAHEGSLLLWMMALSGWTAAVACRSKNIALTTHALTLAMLALITIGFLLFILLTSNPFLRTLPPPADGADLNPLLQDPGLAIHPPLLYMGYVGFAVAFAFAIAALIEGKLDVQWARSVRRWTNSAWAFLTLGIGVGSWWAYYELGWGGWWFWDPVENASFMPWLTGTALIHSLAVTEKRERFKAWTVLLSVLTFALSLLGTFLVRSGIITSVHAFATDPTRGVFILLLLVLTIGGSFLLYALRVHTIASKVGFHPLSRESALLINNLLLIVTAASVLLGTLYPLALDAMGLDKISVGAPYFNSIFFPLTAPLALLIGFGSLARWNSESAARLARQLGPAFFVSLLFGLLVPFAFGSWKLLAFLGSWLASWIILSGLSHFIEHSPRRMPLNSYAMLGGHFGMAVFIIGATFTSLYSIEENFSMVPGDKVELAGFSFTFNGITEFEEDNYLVRQGAFDVFHGNNEVEIDPPQKRFYPVQQNTTTEAGINSGIWYDLYISLGEPIEEQAQRWSVRIHYKAFVNWIWLGALIMALAAFAENFDRRYRFSGNHRRQGS